jgi:hypothetical protein
VAREALALGIPVLAVHSAGIDELAKSLPSGTVHFLPDSPKIEEIIESFQAALKTEVPPNLLRDYKESNRIVINDLIESWIEMVKSD